MHVLISLLLLSVSISLSIISELSIPSSLIDEEEVPVVKVPVVVTAAVVVIVVAAVVDDVVIKVAKVGYSCYKTYYGLPFITAKVRFL